MDKLTIRRQFDDGSALVLESTERPDGSAEGIVLSTAVCVNPECPCREVGLDARRIEWSPDGEVRPRGPALVASLELDSGAMTVKPEALAEAQDPELLEAVRRAFEAGALATVRERWKRVRGQQVRDEWRQVDWSRIELDSLVPFLEISPSRWDLAVISNGQRYWAMDLWCLAPRCTCEEIVVELLGARGEDVGAVAVDVRHATITRVERGDGPLLRRLAQGLLADPVSRAELAVRRKLVREVARELPRVLAPPAPAPVAKPGRNAPCPCGSGKKYKHCCGNR